VDTEYVVLVRDIGGRRLYLSLDLAEFEHQERTLDMHTLLAVLVLVLVLGVLVAWSVGRLVARSVAWRRTWALSPDRGGQRIRVQEPASAELAVIAEALNGYLERNARFVERTRFVDMASHELRTPIAVIGGAADLALVRTIRRRCATRSSASPIPRAKSSR
jgi:signal transduction histidine kinase